MLRGEVYYTNLSPSFGSEQYGVRPVLIISNDNGNIHCPTVICASITGVCKRPRFPTHVYVKDELEIPSVIQLEQLRTIDKRRLERLVCRLSDETMKRVDKALLVSLALPH